MTLTQGQNVTAAALNAELNARYPAGSVSAFSATLLNQLNAPAWLNILGAPNLGNVGQPNGIAQLDSTGKLVGSQTPSSLPGNFSVKGPLPWIDVVAYGAVGDGATDNTTVINNAIAGLPATGGGIYFPPGTYNVASTLTVAVNNVKLFGAGAGVSTIQSTSATADVILFGGGASYSNMSIGGLTIGTNATRTAGNAIKFSNVTGGGVDQCSVTAPFTGIYLTGSSYIFLSDTSIVSPVATGQGIIINTGGNYFFDRIAVFVASTQCTYGLNVQACDSAFIDNCHFVQTGYGVYINPTSATVQKMSFANSAMTSCTNDGVYLNPGASGNVYNLRFEGCRASLNSGNGYNLGTGGTINSVQITGGRAIDNALHGINLQGGTYTLIDCCHIGGNSTASSGVSNGVNVAANVSSFGIRNCKIGLSPANGVATHKWGIQVATGTSNKYSIIANDLSDNVTGGLSDGGSGATKQLIANNPPAGETKSVLAGVLQFSNYAAGVLQTDGSGNVTASASTSNFASTRQTVLTGPTTAGLPNFLPATSASLVVTTQNLSAGNPLIATAAGGYTVNGNADMIGKATANFSWSSLTANSTLYLYVTIASGAFTSGFTTLQPIYQFGGTISITNNQFTFDYAQMIAYMGNGTTAVASNIVFVGECVTATSTVTSITPYAYRGYYESALTATLPSSSTSISYNHNLGIQPGLARLFLRNTTTNAGYAVGDTINDYSLTSNVGVTPGISSSRLVGGFSTPNAANPFQLCPKAGGTAVNLTAADWSYGMVFSRATF